MEHTDHETLFKGTAVGGPLNGKDLNSRYPGGLIVVSTHLALSGVYKYTEAVRQGAKPCFVYEESPIYATDGEALQKAAEGNEYDVRSI